MCEIDAYRQAVNYFYESNFSYAKKILNEIVEQNPADFDALNFLGTISLNENKFKQAISYFNKTIEIYRNHPSANYNLGFCYQNIKEHIKAKEYYLKALILNYSKEDVLNNLGLVCSCLEEYSEAVNYLSEAAKLFPWKPNILYNLSGVLIKLDKYDEAQNFLQEAVNIEPSNLDYNFKLINLYKKKNDNDSAIEQYTKILKYAPDNLEANEGIANIYLAKREYINAEKYLKICCNIIEKRSQIDNNLKINICNTSNGSFFNENIDKQKLFENNSIIKRENNIQAASIKTKLALAKLEQGFYSDALDLFYGLVKTNNEIVEIHYNLAHTLLLLGRFEEGWIEYEWRLRRKEFGDKKFSKPVLENQSVKNKKVLVYDEQGLGDSIQFIRYLKLLKKEDCYLIFQCNIRLFNLYKNLDFIDELISNEKEINLEYDYQIALLSLPKYFKTDEKNIPNEIPYIDIHNDSDDKFSIFNNDQNLKVGLVWAGNPKHTGDLKRSCKLKEFKPFFELEGISFYSIQKGEAVNQLKETQYPIQDMNPLINDFTDTAKIIKKLDLVISVDTSVVHLAGAMEKEVWLLLPFVPDWRWLVKGETTLWYPNMKLFRQKSLNDWTSVIQNVKSELQKKILEIYKKLNVHNSNDCSNKNKMLYLGFPSNTNFGWEARKKYLHLELSKLIHVRELGEKNSNGKNISDKTFVALPDNNLLPVHKITGSDTYGYTFFKNELTDKSLENGKDFTKIIAGSSWCKRKLEGIGISNTDVLIQGIDPQIFYPGKIDRKNDLFVIFSGGKLELRKGHDLVLKAVKILQEKYNDIILINAWYNYSPDSMVSLSSSQYLNFEIKGKTWQEFMSNLYNINNLDAQRIFTLPLVPNNKMRDLYLKSDIGLFPNRCEGGTNLVMMEYMACGKPVIASYNSGHKDILTEVNSLSLNEMKPYKLFDKNDNLISDWEEPDLDEIIDKIEFAYNNRKHIKEIGKNAANDMKDFSWKNTAQKLLEIIYQ